jgi:hypothetical protein
MTSSMSTIAAAVGSAEPCCSRHIRHLDRRRARSGGLQSIDGHGTLLHASAAYRPVTRVVIRQSWW